MSHGFNKMKEHARAVEVTKSAMARQRMISRYGLAETRRMVNEDKSVQRGRARFRAGKAVWSITIDGLRHDAGCECYDCLYGAGKAKWDAVLVTTPKLTPAECARLATGGQEEDRTPVRVALSRRGVK